MSGTSNTTTGNSFSIGKDISFILVSPLGATIQLPKLTGFDDELIYETVKSKVLDGPTRQVSLPDGHKLSVKFDREDGSVDTFFAALEAAYWAAGGFVPQFTGYVNVTERNGTSSRFEYLQLDLQYKGGSWKSGAPVPGELMGYARYKRSV